MSTIRLFPSYTQKENQTTNHCLLLLKILYEESPDFLSTTIANLLNDAGKVPVGVEFEQQIRSGSSTPDGMISQKPFTIAIETKHGNRFNEVQLSNHLEGLKEQEGQKFLIALGSTEHEEFTHPIFPSIKEKAKNYGMQFLWRTFEQFLEALNIEQLPKRIEDAISDLTQYLDESGLLPSWKYRLDVVNCAGSFDAAVMHHVYVCPTVGSAYTHRRSRYFGAYKDKSVRYIAEIQAVIDVTSKEETTLKWQNIPRKENDLIEDARKRCDEIHHYSYPIRVFLLGEGASTDFQKHTARGMRASKQYFNIRDLSITNVQDLATQLKTKQWNDFKSI